MLRFSFAVCILCAILFSCASFSTVYFVEKIDLSSLSSQPNGAAAKKIYEAKSPRYISFMGGSSSSAQINDHAAECIIDEKLSQAEALLLNLIADDESCASAFNNLGIVYESYGDKRRAFEYYSRACLLSSDEDHFRKNLMFLGYEKK